MSDLMDSKTKFRISLLFGIIILAVDLLWLYGSALRVGGGAIGSLPYRNVTRNVSATSRPGFNASSAAAYGRTGYSGFADIAYGAIILIADIAWMYLEFTVTTPSAKKK
jgi:hypothetical protein